MRHHSIHYYEWRINQIKRLGPSERKRFATSGRLRRSWIKRVQSSKKHQDMISRTITLAPMHNKYTDRAFHLICHEDSNPDFDRFLSGSGAEFHIHTATDFINDLDIMSYRKDCLAVFATEGNIAEASDLSGSSDICQIWRVGTEVGKSCPPGYRLCVFRRRNGIQLASM